MAMKIPGEAKLLAGLAAVVLVGGGGMAFISKMGEEPVALPGKPPASPTINPETFDKLLAASRFSKGDANADVTIIEFADFECPSCRKAFRDTLPKALAESKARLVFRQFPLEMHERALPASLATEAAAKQGKFWEMYDGLFQSDSKNKMSDGTPLPALGDADILTTAQKIGLNIEQFNKDLKDPALKSKIEAEVALNVELGISETPTFLIQGKSGKIDRVTGAGQFAQYVAKGGLKALMTGATTPPVASADHQHP